mgnify:CR=1 FL=1
MQKFDFGKNFKLCFNRLRIRAIKWSEKILKKVKKFLGNLGDSSPRPLKFARSTQFFVSFSGSTVSITGQNFIKFGPSVWVSRVFQWKNVHKNGYYGRPRNPIDPKTISLQSYNFSAATVKILTSCDVGVKN